jgi:sec-independent protein translocase protein TatB
MLDLGWQEFFLIATIAVVVVGPKDLPNVIRTVVGWIRKVRTMARDFQGSIEEVAREAELDEIRKEAIKLSNQDLSKTVMDTVDPDRDLADALKDTRAAVEAGGDATENSMLDPNTPTGARIDATNVEEHEVKGWDAASVSTPSNSIMAPPETAAEKPAKKPRAKKPAKAEATDAPAKPARKSRAKPKTTKAKAEPASQAAAPRKPRKPRTPKARPDADTASGADTPVTEA